MTTIDKTSILYNDCLQKEKYNRIKNSCIKDFKIIDDEKCLTSIVKYLLLFDNIGIF